MILLTMTAAAPDPEAIGRVLSRAVRGARVVACEPIDAIGTGAVARKGGGGAVLESAAPFLAWRALVLGCPRFYPDLAPPARDALLSFAERALAAPTFDPGGAEDLFA
jgi:hypothetical protein